MATKRDYYEILGIPKSASEAEIKSAYRKLARQHHPDVDKSPGAEERFKEISEAYQVLSDPQKRQAYNQFGHQAFTPGGGFGGAQGWPGGSNGWKTYSWSAGGANPNVQFDFGGFEDPFDLFEQIFGMSSGGGPFGGFRRRPTYQMDLSFNESIKGVEKEIEVETVSREGRRERKKMKIKVPAGVDNNTRIRFGDIDIVFRVSRHPEFIREGPDIFSEATVSIPQLVLGDVVDVNTIEGKVKVRIPAGTQPGSLVRLKNKGVASLSGGRGDHYVRVNIVIPKNPTDKEKKLYEQLKDLSSTKNKWF